MEIVQNQKWELIDGSVILTLNKHGNPCYVKKGSVCTVEEVWSGSVIGKFDDGDSQPLLISTDELLEYFKIIL